MDISRSGHAFEVVFQTNTKPEIRSWPPPPRSELMEPHIEIPSGEDCRRCQGEDLGVHARLAKANGHAIIKKRSLSLRVKSSPAMTAKSLSPHPPQKHVCSPPPPFGRMRLRGRSATSLCLASLSPPPVRRGAATTAPLKTMRYHQSHLRSIHARWGRIDPQPPQTRQSKYIHL